MKDVTKHPNVLDDMDSDKAADQLGHFIVNNLGINLCAVDRILVSRTSRGEITQILVKFIPENPD